MRQIAVALALCIGWSTSLQAQAPNKPGTSVYGGKEVQASEAPWQAVIYLANKGAKDGLLCGATVVAPSWLLTAAHCFHTSDGHRIPSSMLGMATGTLTLSQRKVLLDFDEPVIFEGYTLGDWDKDIALVPLKRPVSSAMSPVALASGDDEKVSPAVFRVTGWGKTERLNVSDKLLYAVLKPIATEECSKYYGNRLTIRTLCAGDPPQDACHGDSGGPLYTGSGSATMQFGVVVGGEGCGKNPGVYARVSQHRAWIEKKVASAGEKLAVPVQFKPAICTPALQSRGEC